MASGQNLQNQMQDLVHVTTLYALENLADRLTARIAEKNKKKPKKRSCWVKAWLLRRKELGAYDNLMVELANEDIEGYISFQRLSPELFAELLAKVQPLIEKKNTVMRDAIPAGARLAVTLRYLATGK